MISRVLKETDNWDCRFFLLDYFHRNLITSVSKHIACKLVIFVLLFSQSIPVAFGSETAKWICVGTIDITQIFVAGTIHCKIYYVIHVTTLSDFFTVSGLFFSF